MKRGKLSTKRLNVSKVSKLKNKKKDTWVVTTRPGSHKKSDSISLAILIRDILEYAQNIKEVKKIIAKGSVTVDGNIIKDYKFPIGLMDVVAFKDQDTVFRMVLNKKGKLIPVPIKKENKDLKLLQIKNRCVQKGGRITITFHDGKNLITSEKYSIGDSLIASVPAVKIEKHIPLKEGAFCYIKKGKHTGDSAKLVEFKTLGMGRVQAKLQKEDGSVFYTLKRYLLPIDNINWVNVEVR
ncbi:30S ribosomal protein S4e [Candidatus Micrarchaeota archaeon]|nr:30S ribosomal protein S4e [Candidatus Micrarchaeota archaeon]